MTRTHLFCSSQLEVIHVRRRLGSSWHTTGRDHGRDSGCGRHGADSDESPSLRAWPLVSSSYLPRQFNLTRKFQLSLGLGYTRRPGPGPPARAQGQLRCLTVVTVATVPTPPTRMSHCRDTVQTQLSPRAHLATGQAQAVPIFPPGTQGRSNTGSK